jgi:hypothetical protein
MEGWLNIQNSMKELGLGSDNDCSPNNWRSAAQLSAEMAEIVGMGAEVLLPVQNGELAPSEFCRKALAISGLDLVPAIPMKKAATSFTEVLAFVNEVKPRRIHMLGMGYERSASRKLVTALKATMPELEISMDSNRLRAELCSERVKQLGRSVVNFVFFDLSLIDHMHEFDTFLKRNELSIGMGDTLSLK